MMGKTHMFSKGHPLGFVPDYRHRVEAMGEFKRLGSPVRVDSGSYCPPPKRKCVSVNSEERECASGFSLTRVPREVFSLPSMTALDKKDVEMRLHHELAQVKDLQIRLFSGGHNVGSMNGATVASAPGSDMLPKKKAEKLRRSNSVQTDRGAPPPMATAVAPPVSSSINYTSSFKQCANLLKSLMSHVWASPFLVPVDIVKLNIPDYFQIVKQPMDLGTIQKRMKAGMYSTPPEFAADVRLTFSNAMNYNPANNDVHLMAKTLSKNFESRWKLIEKKLPKPDEKPPQPDEKPPQPVEKPPVRKPTKKNSTKRVSIEKEDLTKKKPSKKSVPKQYIFRGEDSADSPVLQPKKRKTSPLVQDAPLVGDIVPTRKRIMTSEQKYDLSARLQSYGAFIPDHVVELIRSHADYCDANEEELELDMDALGDDTLFELLRLLDDYDRVNPSRNLTEQDPHEVKSRSQYELINASVCNEEVNELFDEDVDIGENDPPVLTFPPLVLEDETADRSRKHSASSSSSSSSGSDTDAKAAQQNSVSKEKILPVDGLGHEKDSLDTLNLPEQSTDPVSVSAYGEGGYVSEKVSPEKQIRAALLRSRFADTILKAREKALDQTTKKDPEKLRREREELERLQRQERARLQAEAKAAEDACKRAEEAAAAEAAAEAKRQRDIEREAARKALQEMERTVDINGGSHFLKDLEMLRGITCEEMPNLVGEGSPGFQLGSSNALAKLGLYMKDDEDDEEGDLADAPVVVDIEEGEID
uniref:Transcription factor GTE8 n=1 Tax=Zea mays TaxID=4577 RepID=A0A804NNC0_MAIZE